MGSISSICLRAALSCAQSKKSWRTFFRLMTWMFFCAFGICCMRSRFLTYLHQSRKCQVQCILSSLIQDLLKYSLLKYFNTTMTCLCIICSPTLNEKSPAQNLKLCDIQCIIISVWGLSAFSTTSGIKFYQSSFIWKGVFFSSLKSCSNNYYIYFQFWFLKMYIQSSAPCYNFLFKLLKVTLIDLARQETHLFDTSVRYIL